MARVGYPYRGARNKPQAAVERREKKDVFLPLAIGDFLRDVAHFTTRQIGAYSLLMMAGWVCGGRLALQIGGKALDDEQLRLVTRLKPEEWVKDRDVLVVKYEIGPDGAWIHRGMQRRMLTLGMEIDLGGAPADAGPEQGESGGADAAAAISAKRSAAARSRWQNGGTDANGDAKPGTAHANEHAKSDEKGAVASAKPDANLHANLNQNPRSSTNQLSSLDAPREEEERGSGGLENAGSSVDQSVDDTALANAIAVICHNPTPGFTSAVLVCMPEWRALGLTDDALCIEIGCITDAKRDAKPGWIPNSPNYYTPGLKRLAAAADDGGAGDNGASISADPWEQRVESYRRTQFWMPDWGGKPDSDAPNTAIPAAVLKKHGFGKAA